VQFFVYCRDREGATDLRYELVEQHWSYMDGFADAMIARGPTTTADGETSTGSLHIVDLPSYEAARRFADDEPNWRAGVYESVDLFRFDNLIPRTMWQFTGAIEGYHRFLIIGWAPRPWSQSHEHWASAGRWHDHLIACGSLWDGDTFIGTATLAEVPNIDSAEALSADDPTIYDRTEIHPWHFGGRR
jgi:uncharacterized protein YciI